jgi:hypothetical protein
MGARNDLNVVPRDTTTQLPQANPKWATKPGPHFIKMVMASLSFKAMKVEHDDGGGPTYRSKTMLECFL